jgi:hypothetical protein
MRERKTGEDPIEALAQFLGEDDRAANVRHMSSVTDGWPGATTRRRYHPGDPQRGHGCRMI